MGHEYKKIDQSYFNSARKYYYRELSAYKRNNFS